jgi:hypothetical protein
MKIGHRKKSSSAKAAKAKQNEPSWRLGRGKMPAERPANDGDAHGHPPFLQQGRYLFAFP